MKAEKFSSHSTVLECPATYYDAATKKWISGKFSLSRSFVQFINIPINKDEQFHLHLPLNTLTCLEKRQSNLIYPCLVVCTGSEKHWFGSFASRDAVFNLFELFWRESLISKPYKKISPQRTLVSKSSLGTELLEMLHESKNILIGTANELSEHCEQLHEVEEAVEDLNNDLTVAENVSKSLNTPFANILSKENENISMSPLHKYKVTYSYSNSDNKLDWEKGVLVISNDIILLKKEETTLMQITKDELDSIQVLSPWELCIVHTFSNLRKSCYFMCPQLSRLLKFISSVSHYQQKITYTDDDSSVYDTASCYSSSSCDSSSSSKKLEPTSDQVQEESSVLSEEELTEINTALQNLQMLASEVVKEQENQQEIIDSLTENTDKTRLRMKKVFKKL